MIAGVILAGGRASRMGGGDKGLLPLAGRPILARVIDRLRPQVDLLALNANGDPARFAPFGLPVLPDSVPGRPGPLAGVLAGMDWAAGRGASAVVSAAADTPFFPADLVARLRAAGPFAMAATPGEAGPERHPTFVLWPVSLRDDLRAALAAGLRKVVAWTDPHGCATVLFSDAQAFFNVNTPEDLALAEALAAPMKVFGVTGWKNSGKTVLVERLVAELTARGLRVATVKHAHHGFDVDHPGKDSHRHRAAGAAQVAVASRTRWALMTELRGAPEPTLDALLARLDPVDLVLVEGYKRDRHPKIEARRAPTAQDLIAAGDETIEAIASDAPLSGLAVPVFPLDDIPAIADFILTRVGLAPSDSAPRNRDDCFAVLPAGVDWLPVDTALDRLRAGSEPVADPETVPLADAGGRILAAPLHAARANPPAANAAVDGYGFAHATLGPAPHTLPLLPGRAAAGAPFPAAVPPGHALRILTGALLPAGVDTVVLEEDVTATPGAIALARGLKPRANTRPAGEDVGQGAEILAQGRCLAPQDLALAAATGLAFLPVRRRLRVAVLSTGDEIRPVGSAAAPHQTFDANRPMLLDILRRWEMTPVDLGQAADSREAVTAALDRGAVEADAILTSGGASAGDEDHVSSTLKAAGALEIWRIAVKPGRPLAIGNWRGRPVFGLPGNPVAAFVCTLVFARPVLLRLAGAPWHRPHGLTLPAAFAKTKHAGRREYLRARLAPDGTVEVFPSEGSGRISGLAWATGLVELDDGPRTIRPGDPVRYIPFAELGL